MIDHIVTNVARREWGLLTLAENPSTPEAAVAAVKAACHNTDDAVYALYCAAADAFRRSVCTRRRHKDSAPIWELCETLCEHLDAQFLGLAGELLARIVGEATELPQSPDGTCLPSERYAILQWCDRVARELRILLALEPHPKGTHP